MTPAMVWLNGRQLRDCSAEELNVPKKHSGRQHAAPYCDTCTSLMDKIHVRYRRCDKCLKRGRRNTLYHSHDGKGDERLFSVRYIANCRSVCKPTLVKKPHTFVARRITAEMTKNGRLPQMLAPAAVKKVVKPIQKARKPMMRLETMSMLTLYFFASNGRPGVTIGPRLGGH